MGYPKIISVNLTGKCVVSGINNPDNFVIIGTIVYERNDTEKEGTLLMSVKNLTYHATNGYLSAENKDQLDIYELNKEDVAALLTESTGESTH